MQDATPPALHSALPEIWDKLEDTSRSVERDRHSTALGVLTLPLALAMMETPTTASREPFPVVQDRTAFVEEARAEELSLPVPDAMVPVEEASQVSEADVANRTRLALLARHYEAARLSIGEEARLAIVTERVRRLIPRVTVDDFEALQVILEEAERIDSAEIECRQRLGIDECL
jgi:hypothetical protein